MTLWTEIKHMSLVHTREWIVEITKIFLDKVDVIFADPDLERAAKAFTCQLFIELSINSLFLLNIHSAQITKIKFKKADNVNQHAQCFRVIASGNNLLMCYVNTVLNTWPTSV